MPSASFSNQNVLSAPLCKAAYEPLRIGGLRVERALTLAALHGYRQDGSETDWLPQQFALSYTPDLLARLARLSRQLVERLIVAERLAPGLADCTASELLIRALIQEGLAIIDLEADEEDPALPNLDLAAYELQRVQQQVCVDHYVDLLYEHPLDNLTHASLHGRSGRSCMHPHGWFSNRNPG